MLPNAYMVIIDKALGWDVVGRVKTHYNVLLWKSQW
jgi:hypothetical protein